MLKGKFFTAGIRAHICLDPYVRWFSTSSCSTQELRSK